MEIIRDRKELIYGIERDGDDKELGRDGKMWEGMGKYRKRRVWTREEGRVGRDGKIWKGMWLDGRGMERNRKG